MKARHLFAVRDARADRPEAANARLKALRQVFIFAMKDHETFKLEANPARDVPYLASGNDEGFRAWEPEDVARFEAAHPVGTKARLALGLLLFTGQRRSDVVLLGRQHVRNNDHGPTLRFTQQKNQKRKPVTLEIPIVPELQAIIAASPCGNLTFLVTDFGKGFTASGFGNLFRRWCDEAGLHGLAAHGLRKAAAARLAERGRSERQIMAVTGHSTSKEVVRYTRSAEQKKLARSALMDPPED